MKTINCVDIKREGAQAVMKKLSGLTIEEQLAYWDRRYAEMMQRWARIRDNSSLYEKH